MYITVLIIYTGATEYNLKEARKGLNRIIAASLLGLCLFIGVMLDWPMVISTN